MNISGISGLSATSAMVGRDQMATVLAARSGVANQAQHLAATASANNEASTQAAQDGPILIGGQVDLYL